MRDSNPQFFACKVVVLAATRKRLEEWVAIVKASDGHHSNWGDRVSNLLAVGKE
jgi:hypothetical protein